MKWRKFNDKANDISEDRLQILFDNIQHKVNENYFSICNMDIFKYGHEKFMGYIFYPEMKKFFVKIVNIDNCDIQYVVRYAKDLESCEINCNEEFDSSDENDLYIEVVNYPFNN